MCVISIVAAWVLMWWCVAETGGVTEEQVVVVPLDLVQYEQHQAAFNTVLHHFGEVSVLQQGHIWLRS